jgi:cation:H+ antiporter
MPPATIPSMIPALLILGGLVTLILAAEILVRGSAWIAEALGIRPLVVGLTVVAIGTSAPELVVSIIAAAEDKTDLVLGNIFGSNTANIALILGSTAAIKTIQARDSKLRFEIYWLLFASLLTLIPFIWDEVYSRQLGIAMVVLIGLFLVTLVQRERRDRPTRRTEVGHHRTARQAVLHVLMVLGGIVGLVYGGEALVTGAVRVAVALSLSEAVIGATVIAIGTSLPELATSIVAARRGHPELAVGNVVGSNIFNILLVLGFTATISPIGATWAAHGLRTLVPLVLACILAVLLLGPRRITRADGGILLVVYIGYLVAEALYAR